MAPKEPPLRCIPKEAPCFMDLPYEGWLSKEKRTIGRRSRLFSSSNRRYFTLDFPDELFYYKHSETSTQISRPIRFQDIVKVELLADVELEENTEQKEAEKLEKISFSSSRTRTSFSSILGIGRAERHGFVLHFAEHTREERMILCCSESEAIGWADAISVAISLGARARQRRAALEESEKAQTAQGPSCRDLEDASSEHWGSEASDSEFRVWEHTQ
mmetsp:Transcript_68161/g.108141  ORF Transcript_68161/g.108141 Transcript_68161/m.108141 type:complete len:217 (-) Transcript_68161:49-699(-)